MLGEKFMFLFNREIGERENNWSEKFGETDHPVYFSNIDLKHGLLYFSTEGLSVEL